MFNTQILAGSSGQGGETQQSLKFNDDESQYLSWTPAAAGNRDTWTWSGWAKRANVASGSYYLLGVSVGTSQWFFLGFTNAGTLDVRQFNSSSYDFRKISTAIYRDPSSWYHIVMSYESGNATAEDRIKLYVNGERVTSFSTNSNPSSGLDAYVSQTHKHVIGAFSDNNGSSISSFFDGYMSDINFIDGQALDPTSFGQFTNGYWEKKDYAGSYGQNGFHLTFQDDVVSEGFNTVTYNGTGATQSISGLGFAPDLVWTKARDITYSNLLVDSVRGVTKELRANGTNAEATNSGVTSFDADGYTLGSYDDYNRSVNTFVAWCWDAGTGSAVSNTDGSITSSVKANPSYGFSIASYVGNATSGATVGHGLSSPLELILLKDRSITVSWRVYSSATGGTKSLYLNLTNAAATDATIWNNTDPTSSVFTIGNDGGVNASGNNYIAYCFHSVAGYSSIGSFSGTGASGNAVTGLGFKPAFLMVKGIDVAEHWVMFDNTRSPTNPIDRYFLANTAGVEATNQSARAVDFDTDGFTVDGTSTEVNQSGKNYLYVAFADTREAAFWKDVSGQGNHWTPNNLDYRDSLIDSPANNFATLNPLDSNSNITLAKGNLKASNTSGYWYSSRGTFSPTSGKWYFEAVMPSYWAYLHIGVLRNSYNVANANAYTDVGNWTYQSDGRIHNNGTQVTTNVPASGAGDVMQVAYDLDDGKIWFGINNTWILSGNPTTGANPVFTAITSQGDISPHILVYGSPTTGVVTNFGQDSTFSGNTTAGGNTDANNIGDFAYAPPSGYLALCTANLPTPSIVDGSEYFNTVLYTGDDSTQAITGVGFTSDLTWIKNRAAASTHRLYNSLTYGGPVSAGSTTNYLASNSTIAETASASTLISFDSDGFTVHGSGNDTNDLGETYVAWNWKAGGTAVSNTDGTITSQVSANTDAGFSIVSYTGTGANATVGHGLGVQPSMIITKRRDAVENWPVYTAFTGSSQYAYLDVTNAFSSATSVWQGVDPTSSVFSIGTSLTVNSSGGTYISYCFANSDIIKAGSYTGNGSSDGPFVFTGGRVQWLMIKRTDSAHSWYIFDDVRTPTNPQGYNIMANSSNAEDGPTNIPLDFLSNGFKPRGTGGSQNASGGSYIYLAIMESPLKHSNAR